MLKEAKIANIREMINQGLLYEEGYQLQEILNLILTKISRYYCQIV